MAFDNIPDEWESIHDIPTIEEMVSKVQSDPIFADQFFFQETNNPENADSGTYQPLADFQGYLFDVLDNNDVVWIEGARGSAKSSGFARWLDGYCLRYPGVQAGLFAPSFRQSRQLHDYCVGYINANAGVDSHIYKIESELAYDPKRGQEVIMGFKNTSFIEALPAGDGEKLRGKRYNVIGIDEAYLLDETFHVSHILPMGNVKIRGRRTKIVYLTTSFYSDVYAYKIRQGIAREIANGTPGYAIVSITLDDVLKSGFPYDKKHILHQLRDQTDESGNLSDEAKMTFFNIWIKGGASFYTPGMVAECQRADIPVIERKPEEDKTPFVLGVDPAGMGEDKFAMGVISCPGNDERHLNAVYLYEKQRPEEIAGHIHKMVDRYGMSVIVMDKSGAMGSYIADLCAKDTQLIDGEWVKRTPIMLWDHMDARKARAHIVLTIPSDERMIMAVMGNRVDSTISSEIQLKNVLHLNMRQKMQTGKFFAPKMLKDSDYYNSERGELMDNISESLAQFPKIDRKKNPDGKTLYVDERGNWKFTRPAKDDGAYAIIYSNYAANILYRLMDGKKKDDHVPFLWGTDNEEARLRAEAVTHSIVLPRL